MRTLGVGRRACREGLRELNGLALTAGPSGDGVGGGPFRFGGTVLSSATRLAVGDSVLRGTG